MVHMSGIKVGWCVCHPEFREPISKAADGEWQHEDGSAAEVVHLHVSTEARDCDSTYTRGYRFAPMPPPGDGHLPGEGKWCRCDRCQFSFENDAHNEAWSMLQPPWWEERVQNEASLSRSGGAWLYRASWATDEGYRRVEVDVCSDARCDLDETSYSDSTAEAAGY